MPEVSAPARSFRNEALTSDSARRPYWESNRVNVCATTRAVAEGSARLPATRLLLPMEMNMSTSFKVKQKVNYKSRVKAGEGAITAIRPTSRGDFFVVKDAATGHELSLRAAHLTPA